MRLFFERTQNSREFGVIGNASGTRNFFGQGYPHHKPARYIGLDFTGSYFVANTTTLEPWAGNMPMKEDGMTPRDLFPDCIVVYPLKGLAITALDLPNLGLKALLREGRWQFWPEPFFLSLMAVGATREERLEEWRRMAELLERELPNFRSVFGIQAIISCPNVGLHLGELCGETIEIADSLRPLKLPVLVKVNAHFTAEAALAVEPYVDGLVQGNSMPWDTIPPELRLKLFGRLDSPLAKYGGGGASGRFLKPFVIRRIREYRRAGFKKAIVGLGGISGPEDAIEVLRSGADAVEFGTMCMTVDMRNVRRTIRAARKFAAQRGRR